MKRLLAGVLLLWNISGASRAADQVTTASYQYQYTTPQPGVQGISGEVGRPIRATVQVVDGAYLPWSLEGLTVRGQIIQDADLGTNAPTVTATVLDATNGIVRYSWTPTLSGAARLEGRAYDANTNVVNIIASHDLSIAAAASSAAVSVTVTSPVSVSASTSVTIAEGAVSVTVTSPVSVDASISSGAFSGATFNVSIGGSGSITQLFAGAYSTGGVTSTAADTNKYLKGDGSWGDGTGTNVYTYQWPSAPTDSVMRQLWRIGTNDPVWATVGSLPSTNAGWTNIVFNYSGTQEVWVAGRNYLAIGKIFGGGGGAGGASGNGTGGSSGGWKSFTTIIASGTVCEIWVGQGGRSWAITSTPVRAWPNGGLCSTNGRSQITGTGGAASRYYQGTNLVACGSGGGGSGYLNMGGNGGNVGANGASTSGTGGSGGTEIAGGNVGGGWLRGGDAVSTNCAGGGEGAYGGGAGQIAPTTAAATAAGGGGASWVNSLFAVELGGGTIANMQDLDYPSGIGVGASYTAPVHSFSGHGFFKLWLYPLQ